MTELKKCCKCPAPNMMLLGAQMQKCSCSCHTPTVEPTECDHSAMVGGFCKCARKALNLTEPTETGWEEEFDENVLAWKSSDPHVSSSPLVLIEPYRFAVSPKEVKNFIRETLARQKEDVRKEVLGELEEIIRLMFIDSASTDEEVWRNKTIYEAITIIKNLKGVE